jgi:Ca2+-dependent lipid-binding protein
MAGQLTVTIVEAKNLRDEDTATGENDAYAEIYVDDDYKQRTATIQNNNNPQWNETFNLFVAKTVNRSTFLFAFL